MARRARGHAERRRGRDAGHYRRAEPARDPYDWVLIVCEGQKTEPYYLRGLRAAWRLSSANIEVVSAPGSDPLSVVQEALRVLEREPYDRAFCVLDRDTHANFDAAMTALSNSPAGQAGRLQAIVSDPCFEVWIRLHFGYTAAPYEAARGESIAAAVLRGLQPHFPDYEKGRRDVFELLAERLEAAMTHAARLERENKLTGASQPSTQMHHLIDYLMGLRRRAQG